MKKNMTIIWLLVMVLACLIAGCDQSGGALSHDQGDLKGTITVSGTWTANGGGGNAYGGDGGTFYLDATANATDIQLTGATFNVNGGSGGISGQVGSAGTVTAYTQSPGAVLGTPTVNPSSAYIKRP